MSILTTLYIGIDVSKRSNTICAIDFEQKVYCKFTELNNEVGATAIKNRITPILINNKFTNVQFIIESTGVYSYHIATFLSSNDELMKFNSTVYCVNPKAARNYKSSYVDSDKTDPADAFMLADFGRVGRTKNITPWRGPQLLALQRLTRYRIHLTEQITREKNYVLNNIFLKFSEMSVLENKEFPFSNKFGATSKAVLTDFISSEEIVDTSIEDLTKFICTKGKGRFSKPEEVAILLQKAARDSYRLDKVAYDPINIAIASSLNCIKTFENEIKLVTPAIESNIKGINPQGYEILKSIPGIGPVFASGILSEIGSIEQFEDEEGLAKYAGITWRKKQSGKFEAEDTQMTKTGNAYLRYYIAEATASVVRYLPEYNEYFNKKYNEVTTHQYKRALALTSRKLIRLIFGLLRKNQLYKTQVNK